MFYPIGFLLLLQSYSCKQDDNVEEAQSFNQEQKDENTMNFKALYSEHHTIGEEEAAELALDASPLFDDGNALKSGKIRRICETRVLGSEENTLRSGSGNVVEMPDTLAYLFNFADSSGYAIICADDRVGSPILAYTSSGTIGKEIDNPSLAMILDNIEEYLLQSIIDFEEQKDSLRRLADLQLQEQNECLKSTFTGKFKLYTNENVNELLHTQWGQGSPYNTYTPLCSDGYHTPTGCVAVATAQIMAYYEFPKSLDGYSFNWTGMKETEKADGLSLSHKNSVARLMQLIGSHVNMKYDCNGSGAQTSDAVSWLHSLGYQTSSSDYSWTTAKKALDTKTPIIMNGSNKKTVTRKKILGITVKTTTHYSEGHAWVVDGYKTITIQDYSYVADTETGKTTNKLLSTSYSDSYLHVNWGWNGGDNDYFVAGCFNPTGYNFQYKQKMHIVRRN